MINIIIIIISVLLENTPFIKYIQIYIWDGSDIFFMTRCFLQNRKKKKKKIHVYIQAILAAKLQKLYNNYLFEVCAFDSIL